MKWAATAVLAFGSLTAANAVPQGRAEEASRVPATLMPPEGHVVLFKVTAVGTQVYRCEAGADDPGWLEWVLKGPDADLFDEGGRKVGRHFAGPTWEAAEDGSTVVGTPIAKLPAPKAGDIPWLLLKRKAGAGEGRFGRVDYIQRLDTEGGTAPPAARGGARRGQELWVKYRATYVFYCAKE
jgi:hypothetical protein